LKQSTLVTIAVAFVVAIVAVIWVCYFSFKGSVMSFEASNAPGPLPTPVATRPPPPVGPPPVERASVAPHTEAPARVEDVFPASIPTIAPTVVTPVPQLPNGPPPPDG
jgi:hypothetical protein